MNYSGYHGNPSLTLLILLSGPIDAAPVPHFSQNFDSLSCLFYFSSSITYFFNFTTDVHFFSRMSFTVDCTPLDSYSGLRAASSSNNYAVFVNLFFTRYSLIAKFSSSFCLEVNSVTILILPFYYKSFSSIQNI